MNLRTTSRYGFRFIIAADGNSFSCCCEICQAEEDGGSFGRGDIIAGMREHLRDVHGLTDEDEVSPVRLEPHHDSVIVIFGRRHETRRESS